MLIFASLALLGVILLVGGSLLGHDHDHDVSDGHDADHGNEPTISIFSTKVIGMFIMGFGAGGCIMQYYVPDPMLSSLVGAGTGVFLGAVMYYSLKIIYSQQSNSAVSMNSLIGRVGVVTVEIRKGLSGQVQVGNDLYLALESSGNNIPKGGAISVVGVQGNYLVVNQMYKQ